MCKVLGWQGWAFDITERKATRYDVHSAVRILQNFLRLLYGGHIFIMLHRASARRAQYSCNGEKFKIYANYLVTLISVFLFKFPRWSLHLYYYALSREWLISMSTDVKNLSHLFTGPVAAKKKDPIRDLLARDIWGWLEVLTTSESQWIHQAELNIIHRLYSCVSNEWVIHGLK